MATMRSSLAPKLGLLLGSAAVSLLVIEAGLRFMGYKPRHSEVNASFASWAAPDREMGWVNRGGTWTSSEPGHVQMSFDADGRRHDPAAGKPNSAPRILVVGCSFTQGYGVGDEDTYAHQINRSLPGNEVLNFGTGGYGAYQSRLRVDRYFAASHEDTPLVIYGLFYSHHLRDLAPMPWILMLTMQDGSYMVPPNIKVRAGEIVESPGGPVGLWPLEDRSAIVALLHHAVMRVQNRVTPAMGTPAFHHSILQMQKAVKANNAALLIVGLVPIPADDLAWLKAQRENGVDFVACDHPDPQSPELQVGGIGHPNERLHRWWAACALKALAERGYKVDQTALSGMQTALQPH
jgi:hypothetical protein